MIGRTVLMLTWCHLLTNCQPTFPSTAIKYSCGEGYRLLHFREKYVRSCTILTILFLLLSELVLFFFIIFLCYSIKIVCTSYVNMSRGCVYQKIDWLTVSDGQWSETQQYSMIDCLPIGNEKEIWMNYEPRFYLSFCFNLVCVLWNRHTNECRVCLLNFS